MKWETTAGLPTRGLLYAQLHEKLIECQEICLMISHLQNTEDNHMDKLLAKGWLGVGELFKRIQFTITEMAKGKLQ